MSKIICVIGVVPRSLHNFRGPLIKELVKRGHKVYAFGESTAHSTDVEKIELCGASFVGYNVGRHGVSPIEDLKTFIDLFKKVRKLRPDVVLTYTIKPNIYGTFVSWLLRTRARIAMVEGAGFALQDTEDSLNIIRRIAKYLYRCSLRKAHTVIFLNRDNKEHFYSDGLVGDHQVTPVFGGIGVPLEKFSYSPNLLTLSPIRFLFVGRLLNEKGVSEFVNAAEKLVSKYGKGAVRFEIVGQLDKTTDSIDPDSLTLAIESGVVIYEGHTENIVEKYINCDVFVLPSYHEGFPRSTMEAMSVGRAVVTTNVPGCKETVVDGENGFLVSARSVSELADAMERFVLDPKITLRMGEASRKIAERDYDSIKVNEDLADIVLGL